MSQQKIRVAILGVLLVGLVVWHFEALAYQWDYRTCLLSRADHYANIASLRGAPDRQTYDAQSALTCEALESERRFETAEMDERQMKWGLRAVLAYTSLIETYQIDSYRSSRAAVYANLGQFERSLADYDYLILTNPANYWMYENRAKVYVKMGRPALALQDYETLYEQALADQTNSQAYLDRIAGVIAELRVVSGM